MPAKTDFDNLVSTTYTDGGVWTANYDGTGVAGYVFTSKDNSKSVFLPAAGLYWNDTFIPQCQEGSYWTVTSQGTANSMYNLKISPTGAQSTSYFLRNSGSSVRAIYNN